jgi:hypothetical protein
MFQYKEQTQILFKLGFIQDRIRDQSLYNNSAYNKKNVSVIIQGTQK